MAPPGSEYVVSTELECQTWLRGRDAREDSTEALSEFLHHLPRVIPCLPAEAGWFTPYGRFYPDCGHLELAAIECDTPYVLPSILERMQLVCRRVIEDLEGVAGLLRLANNNHAGLLHPRAPTWGSHENYLVERLPMELTDLVLPFLATRFYAGSGGIEAGSGSFVASVRAQFIHDATGGSTTMDRALHSTCRNENHMGCLPARFRYHLICGDGKRSHFNIALQFGATALALKAICFDDGFLSERLRRFDHAPLDGSWVTTLHEWNPLARPGRGIAVEPRALAIQRTYWEAAERFTGRNESPEWTERTLHDWDRTLTAAAEGDVPWLAARLDAFAKYELFSGRLAARGRSWVDARRDAGLLAELALLDHEWHDFTAPDSCFETAERAGLLDHRVGPRVAPGEEAEPWIPEVATRARPRARLIVERAGSRKMTADWSSVFDHEGCRLQTLRDPFATEFTNVDPGETAATREILARIRGRRSRARNDPQPF